jgi:ABC-2 type transport system ATP-binding protein
MQIIADHISKSFKALRALDDVSLSVRPGELFGVIGPDGAGKTTLFRILATLLLPDSGTGTINGLDVVRDFRAIRNQIGYMPGRFSLYQDLSIEENLGFFAAVFGTTLAENYDLIEPIYRQIEPFKKRRAGALSGGMKQKLALCCALVHKPEILLLDEPGTGVDPVSRKEFWDMLAHLRDNGLTMLVSTPNMDEAALCNRIALMQGGRIIATDTPQGIIDAFQYPLFAVKSAAMHQLIADLRVHKETYGCFGFGQYAHLSLRSAAVSASDITEYLRERHHTDIEVTPITPDIEDCFIAFNQSTNN